MTKPSPGQLKFITLTLNVPIKDVGVNLKVHVRGLRKHRIAKVQGRKGDFAKLGGSSPTSLQISASVKINWMAWTWT